MADTEQPYRSTGAGPLRRCGFCRIRVDRRPAIPTGGRGGGGPWSRQPGFRALAQTLQTLERDGLVNRHSQATISVRVDYSLTDHGHELSALLVPLAAWALQNADDIISGQDSTAT